TSAACGLPIAIAGALSFMVVGWQNEQLPEWSLGFVYLPAMVGIAATSMLFARLGATLAHRLPPTLLKRLFELLLVTVGINLLICGALDAALSADRARGRVPRSVADSQVWPEVPDRHGWCAVAGVAPGAALRTGVEQGQAIRPGILGGHGGDRRRTPGLRAVLRPGVLPQRPEPDPAGVEGRHVLSWRPDRRAVVHLDLRPAQRQAVLRADGLHRALRTDRAGRRAHRQLHQRRTLGQGDRRALGDGLPHRSAATGASPFAALPVRPGGRRAVSDPLVLFAQTATDHGGVRAVRRVLRHLPLHRRVRPRAGCTARLPGVRLADHGPGALRADGVARRRDDRLGLSARGRQRFSLIGPSGSSRQRDKPGLCFYYSRSLFTCASAPASSPS